MSVSETNDIRSLAELLSVSEKSINYFLYKRKLREKYTYFTLKKRSGKDRQISVPPSQLRSLQRRLASLLEKMYRPRACAHGFIADRSIVTNAESHVRKRIVLNFDLQDFFPSIHLGRIRGVLMKPPFEFSEREATLLAQIATMRDGVLPQGGAASPIISNIVCRQLDNRLSEFCRDRRVNYSRYADDITLSSHKAFPSDVVAVTDGSWTLSPNLRDIVTASGFAINESKTRIRSARRRQQVTGLVVNKRINVPRRFINGIEYRLHLCQTYGEEIAGTVTEEYDAIRNVLRGQLAYLKMVRGEHDFVYRRLCRRFSLAFGEPAIVPPLTSAASSRLTSDLPRSNGWADAFARLQEAMLFLNVQIDQDEYCASAFHVGHGIFATAGHNVEHCTPEGRATLTCFLGDDEVAHESVMCSQQNDVGMVYAPNCGTSIRTTTQLRLPEIGEEVCAIGYPSIPQRHPTLVMHIGVVEALPTSYDGNRFLQVSFQSGGGMSGGCLLDAAGFVVGIMVENVFMKGTGDNPAPDRPYGQAVPIEYFDEQVYFSEQVQRLLSVAESH